MALCEVRFASAALQKQEALYAIVPEGRGPFPVLYLLHGLGDDYTIWQRRTSLERYVAGLPLIVVLPDGDRSFYCNRPGGPAYEDHIARDVVGTVDRLFRTRRSARGRAIGGLSMGGYGAMMLALRHPDRFGAASSHSGALFFGHRDLEPSSPADAETVNRFWRSFPAGHYDCFALSARLQAAGRLPALRLDCGRDDFLLDCNRAFHRHLRRIGARHVYREYPGTHEWGYWDLHVRETIRFALEHLEHP